MGVVLGVTRSLGGRSWKARLGNEVDAMMLAQRLDLPEVLARILAARGVTDSDAAGFLEPRLKTLMPDPAGMVDMDRAAGRIADAVEAGETVGVFGDYDVDGATSTALLVRYLEAVGTRCEIHIPDRRSEGYGPNIAALKRLKERGAGPVLTVDCGITAFEPLGLARRAGIDVIVLDHHQAAGDLPCAVALVNPNRPECTSGLGHLAAVGVTFMTLVAVNRELRRRGRFAGRDEPDLLQWLDLVALGTACDSVPLVGLNRAFVRQGLKVMGRGGNAGLAALGRTARISGAPTVHQILFMLGPRINAGGRIGSPDLGVRLLTARDPEEAGGLAARLDDLNAERRTIEQEVVRAATSEAGTQAHRNCIVVSGAGWHPGVVGIVASRLVETFHRPAVVISVEDGVGKGSCRSRAGIGIGAAVAEARMEGLLVNGGGHPMAAGLTVDEEKIGALAAFLDARLASEVEAVADVPDLGIDAVVNVGAANDDLVRSIDRVGPFGVGNARPRFVLKDAMVRWAKLAGERHVRCVAADLAGARLDAIAFRAAGTPLGEALLGRRGASLHLAGHLEINRWNDRERLQFVVEDAAVPP